MITNNTDRDRLWKGKARCHVAGKRRANVTTVVSIQLGYRRKRVLTKRLKSKSCKRLQGYQPRASSVVTDPTKNLFAMFRNWMIHNNPTTILRLFLRNMSAEP